MKESIKGLLLIVFSIGLGILGYFLVTTEYKGYSILCFTVLILGVIIGIVFMFNGSDPTRAYENNIKTIINTFDSILVKSTSVPRLEGRNIIIVGEFDDMIDAQLEIRKPICYYMQKESCSFVLLDDKEAYVYVEKLNPNVISPIEIELNEIKLKQKKSEDMDSEMLRDIERTTIVKLSNKKSYKVSPIRKENQIKVEEKEKTFNSKNNVIIEDLEIL